MYCYISPILAVAYNENAVTENISHHSSLGNDSMRWRDAYVWCYRHRCPTVGVNPSTPVATHSKSKRKRLVVSNSTDSIPT